MTTDDGVVRLDSDTVLPLIGPRSLEPLMERIGNARYVLLGEASHGTAEFYAWRALLTRKLIEELGFDFVAVEGDWPDCRELHRCVVGEPQAPEDPREVLEGFRRWPRWMWANTEVLDFARWLREHNLGLSREQRVGFFGLDVYSLWESLNTVLGWLQENMPEQAEVALEAYRCFEPYGEDPRTYAQATRLVPESCEAEVVDLLTELRRDAQGSTDDGSADFDARQNAEVVAGAERYYRSMVRGGSESWNIRDQHMADTLDRLMQHHGPRAKVVVWEHNSHIGDARATDMATAGMVNVGQLVREQHKGQGVVLVGFGTYEGRTVAGRAWGADPEPMPVPPAREGSVEELLHRTVEEDAGMLLLSDGDPNDPFRSGKVLPHRAIGVVYHPGHDRWGNYVPTVMSERYDAFLFFDRTHALVPLHSAGADTDEKETWPSGR